MSKKNKEKKQGKEKEAMAARSMTKGERATTGSGAATTRRGGATTTSKSATASAKGKKSTNEAPEPSTVAAGTKRKRDAADAAAAAHDDDEDNRATKKARKMIIDLSARIELFRTDRMVKDFAPHDVRCAACNTVIKTEPDRDFSFTNWDKHRFHCRRIAQWAEPEHAPSQEKLKEWQLGRNAIAEKMVSCCVGIVVGHIDSLWLPDGGVLWRRQEGEGDRLCLSCWIEMKASVRCLKRTLAVIL